MNSLYTNATPLNSGFHIDFNKPLDDRIAQQGVSALYINKTNPTACPLYGKVYNEMVVAVYIGGEVVLYACKDASPYEDTGSGNPSKLTIDANNLSTYWTQMSGGQYRLNKLPSAVGDNLASYQMEYKAPGASDFTPLNDCTINIPKDYVVKEVHLCKAEFDGRVYTETSQQGDSDWDDDDNDVYIHFIWQTKDSAAKKSETYLKVSDVINVDVTNINAHIDASIAEVNKHIDSSVKSINTHIDSSWAALNKHIDSSYVSLNSSVASHIDASVKAINTHIDASWVSLNTHIDSSWVSLNNKIDSSWVSLNRHIDSSYVALNSSVASHIDASVNAIKNNIDSSWVALNTHIDASVKGINDHIDASVKSINTHIDSSVKAINNHIDSSVNKLEEKIASINSSINNADIKFNGSMYSDKSFSTLSAHGNLPKNTSVAALEKMTISELLAKILFEVAIPKRTKAASASIGWASSSAFKTTVDVGHALPIDRDFAVTYASEEWNWTATSGETGTAVKLHTEGAKRFYRSTTNTTSGGSTSWPGTAVEGTNGYYYATVAQVVNKNAVDSLGSDKDSKGNYYKQSVASTLTTGSTLTFNAAYKAYSNATKYYTSSASAIADKGTTVNFAGNTTKTASIFCGSGNTTVYLKFGQVSPNGDEKLHLYIPNSCTISSMKGLNDVANVYEIPMTYVQNSGSSATTTINNGYVNGTFKDYIITPLDGMTNVEVVIKK